MKTIKLIIIALVALLSGSACTKVEYDSTIALLGGNWRHVETITNENDPQFGELKTVSRLDYVILYNQDGTIDGVLPNQEKGLYDYKIQMNKIVLHHCNRMSEVELPKKVKLQFSRDTMYMVTQEVEYNQILKFVRR